MVIIILRAYISIIENDPEKNIAMINTQPATSFDEKLEQKEAAVSNMEDEQSEDMDKIKNKKCFFLG